MLFAVEGGGFLSSSASGYSNGLALLIFGQRNEDRNPKVSPWNHYHLVQQQLNNAQGPSRKHQVPQDYSFCTCFGCVSSCYDRSLNLKSDRAFNHSENSAESSSDKTSVRVNISSDENERKIGIKSSLKNPSTHCCVVLDDDDARSSDVRNDISCFTRRRKVRWSDTCGNELAEIREFELSDDEIFGDDSEIKLARRCECVIQ